MRIVHTRIRELYAKPLLSGVSVGASRDKEDERNSLSKHSYIHHIQRSTEPSVHIFQKENACNAARIPSTAILHSLKRLKSHFTTPSAGIIRTNIPHAYDYPHKTAPPPHA